MDKPKLPVYRFEVLADDDSQLNAVALVDRPAIEMDWQAFNATNFKFSITNKEKRIVSGPLMVAGLPIYRRDDSGEYYGVFEAEDIYNLVNKFFRQGKLSDVNLMHSPEDKVNDVYMIESFIIDSDRGIHSPKGYNLTNGSWFGSYKVNNEALWNDFIATGEFRGFSVEGIFKTVKIYEKTKDWIEELEDIIKDIRA